MTRIMAMYLPQYHQTQENDMFWGEGFTDWTSVKRAESLYKGHNQPKVPLDYNYYDLSTKEAIKWQVDLAKKYGIYGFGIYHYWFENGKKVLYKPAEVILNNKDIDIPFFLAWDNVSWIRSWSKIQGNNWNPIDDNTKIQHKGDVLLKLDYGEKKDWETHFNYLLPFFLDPRYEKNNGKPIFVFYSNTEKDKLIAMGKYWNELAQKSGLPGLYLITRSTPFNKNKIFDGVMRYEPLYSGWQGRQILNQVVFNNRIQNDTLKRFNYDTIWRKILFQSWLCADKDVHWGGFVGYDDTPRRGRMGKIVCGATPEKFFYYMNKMVKLAEKKQKDYIFLTAWNEWGEGAYMEPDTINQYQYLNQIIKINKKCSERNKNDIC